MHRLLTDRDHANRNGVWRHESHRRPRLARTLAPVEPWSLGVENGLHYRRDVTLREDAGRTTALSLGHTMAALNNLVIGLTIGRGWRNLAKARRYFDAHPDQALRLLCARPTPTL